MRVEGSVAVVTGAAGGIGYAIAQRLLECGAQVVVTDLDIARVDATIATLQKVGPGRVDGRAGDCSSENDVHGVLALTQERFGPVDLYVANAGVARGRGLEASEADWATSINVNVLAHVRAARLLIPGWLERGHGYFLSTASAAGLLTQLGSAAYSVSKHAAVAFAEWLSVTYGSRGVVVSCLCPMGVNSAMFREGLASDDAVTRMAAKAVAESGAVMEPLQVADAVIEGVRTERFLILPHQEVLDFYRNKASDYDRWLASMRRHQDALA